MTLREILLKACVIGAMVVFGLARLSAQSAQTASGPVTPKTADEAYKNIQVLKGVPADQLIPAMQFITASLGVQCDFCHVESAFEKDDKETKQTARKMMRMMFAINKDNFDDHREVTCYACHRGAHKPVITPILSEADVLVAEPAVDHGDTVALPSAEQIIGKYLQAVGGGDAAAGVSTRIEKGTLTVGSERFPVEIFAKAPAQRMTTVHFPGGDSVTAVSADAGWLGTPGRGVHDMSPAEADSARVDAELFFPASVRQLLHDLRVQRQEPIKGQETYVLTGTAASLPRVQLYFDQHSGLLLRVLRFVETPLGLNPTEIDYEDYREMGGVKTPFRWTLARPNGRFTIQIDEMQQNAPIADTKFVKPRNEPLQ